MCVVVAVTPRFAAVVGRLLVCFVSMSAGSWVRLLTILLTNCIVMSVQAPFDSPDADVIIRSLDDVSFGVHKNVLCRASPVFATMLVGEEPVLGDVSGNEDGGIGANVYRLLFPEGSMCLDNLLRLCYPVPDPPLVDLHPIALLLEASVKYKFQRGIDFGRARLVQPTLLKRHPFDVYAVAYRYQMEEEVRVAARATLRLRVPWTGPLSVHWTRLSAIPLIRLIEYHNVVRTEAIDSITDEMWWDVFRTVPYFPCFDCNPTAVEDADSCQFTLDVRLYMRLAHRMLSSTPCCDDGFGNKLWGNVMFACNPLWDDGASCQMGGCREKVVAAIYDVHTQVLSEINLAVTAVSGLLSVGLPACSYFHTRAGRHRN